uniref:DUF5641 domain-containing protein n=1 Tax=Onchocerca volvulus TaxID=6282 RepID=A0A8R1XTJ6_ONCVO
MSSQRNCSENGTVQSTSGRHRKVGIMRDADDLWKCLVRLRWSRSKLTNFPGCTRWNVTPFEQPEFPPYSPERMTVSRPSRKSGRFVSRRRRPDFVLSDNAKNFVLASKLIQENSNQDQKPLKWQFITPGAPWQGDVYERMVGVVKRTLQRAVKKNLLEEDEFNTLITEVESLVNERSLVDYEKEGEQQNLINRYQNIRRKLQRLRKIWQEKYLEELRKRTRKSHKNSYSRIRRKPIIGEVVFLKGEGPRNSWKMSRVEKGRKDGLCRSAVVRMSNTRKRHQDLPSTMKKRALSTKIISKNEQPKAQSNGPVRARYGYRMMG